MKKVILSLTLMGVLSMTPAMACMANQDSPNDKVNHRKSSAEKLSTEQVSETSILVEDTLNPKCKCTDENCKKEEEKGNKVEKDKKMEEKKEKKEQKEMEKKKEICPKENDKIKKENCPKESCPRKNETENKEN